MGEKSTDFPIWMFRWCRSPQQAGPRATEGFPCLRGGVVPMAFLRQGNAASFFFFFSKKEKPLHVGCEIVAFNNPCLVSVKQFTYNGLRSSGEKSRVAGPAGHLIPRPPGRSEMSILPSTQPVGRRRSSSWGSRGGGRAEEASRRRGSGFCRLGRCQAPCSQELCGKSRNVRLTGVCS